MFKQWTTLVSKELRLNLYSLPGIIFMLLFLIVSGCLLWLIPGNYNIPDNGYASLSSFFSLAPVLLLFLIPALSMRSLAEEKRLHTWMALKSRPVTIAAIVSAKIAALFSIVFITLLPTLVYVGCVWFYGQPAGNLDMGAVAASYTGLLFLIAAFISLSVFASGLTSNQVVALITGMLLCVFFYYGWHLAGLEKLGFLSHYQSVQRGLIETRDLAYFLAVGSIAYYLILLILNKRLTRLTLGTASILILFIMAGLFFNFRFDWTKDKRYTVSPVSKALLKTVDRPVEVEIYLTGNLNPGFARLQESVIHLLKDYNELSPKGIQYQMVDPYRKGKDFIDRLNTNGMSGIAIHERSGDGRQVQNIVFPYILVKYKDRSIPVTLLVNQPGHSGEDNLNLSGELLEYRLAHAIRLLSQDESKRIVFLEGHGEWPEEAISEITDRLSYEYTIDRGALSGRPAELNEYDAVIIAGPQSPFSETDKWAVDQYLMQGGSLLWLINGVQIRSYDELAQSGETLSRANDLNLNDLFFTYGFRINPVILQDRQCLTLPIAQTNASGVTDYVPAPWYFAPVLMPDNQSEVTKGLSPVKTEWASTVSLVGENTNLRREVLLASSPEAHLLPAPASIRLDETVQTTGENYFNASNLPVAVLLQGVFPSVFQNRPAFPATSDQPFLSESQPARMIVIASDELIIDPLGYDRYSQTWFANGEFIVNAVDFLTDNTGLPALKNKSLHRQSLNRQALQRDRQRIVFFNLVLPPALLLLVFLTLSFIRKRKYGLKRK